MITHEFIPRKDTDGCLNYSSRSNYILQETSGILIELLLSKDFSCFSLVPAGEHLFSALIPR